MEFFYSHTSEFSLILLMRHFNLALELDQSALKMTAAKQLLRQVVIFPLAADTISEGRNSLDFQFGFCIFFHAEFKSQQYCGTMHPATYFGKKKKNESKNCNALHIVSNLIFKGPYLLIKCRWRLGPESWFVFTSTIDFLRALVSLFFTLS